MIQTTICQSTNIEKKIIKIDILSKNFNYEVVGQNLNYKDSITILKIL